MIEEWLQVFVAFGSLGLLGLAKFGLMRLVELSLRSRNNLSQHPISTEEPVDLRK